MTAVGGVPMTFAENLKRLRESRGWTQAHVAKLAGAPLRSYQNWELGLREPRLDALGKLSAAFGVSYDELLEGTAEEKAPPEPPPPPRRLKKK